MANNRMYLVNTRTNTRIYVAKYYPSLGWYSPEGVEQRLTEGFDEADFGHLSVADRVAKQRQVGFGPPYAGGGEYGAEWKLEFEEDGTTSPA